jgi:hypothetical protein
MAFASRAFVALVFTAVGAVGALAQQLPPQGCNACVTAAHPPTSSSAILFRVLGLDLPYGGRAVRPRLRLSLPPPPEATDIGAVVASTRIVLARNRKLRENLAVAEAASRPPAPPDVTADGEVVIRIASIHPPPSPSARRDDVPKDAFVAIPLRRVAYPQWSPAPR